jgi:hypothetical protein
VIDSGRIRTHEDIRNAKRRERSERRIKVGRKKLVPELGFQTVRNPVEVNAIPG